MTGLLKLIQIDVVATLMVLIGCGGLSTSSTNSVKFLDSTFPRLFSQWKGEYTGIITYTYGPVQDRRGNEGFPARLIIKEYKGAVRFDLTTSVQRLKWTFDLPPSLFASPSVEFSRNIDQAGSNAQYSVSIALTDKSLTGIMKRYSRSSSGKLIPQGAYVFTLTKQGID